jgi:signal transduction histidine kinase
MVAVDLNGVSLIRLPEYVYPSAEPTPDPVTGEWPKPIPVGIEPAAATPAEMTTSDLWNLVAGPVRSGSFATESDLAAWNPANPGYDASAGVSGVTLRESLVGVLVGGLLMFGFAWWLGTGRAGESVRRLAYPLGLATGAPLVLQPLALTWSPAWVAIAGVLVPLSMLPLAAALVDRIETPQERRLALVGTAAFATAAFVIGVARIWSPPWQYPAIVVWLIGGGITLLPGLLAAGPALPRALRIPAAPGPETTTSGRLLHSSELAVVGATPLFGIVSTSSPFIFPISLWIIGVLVAGRFTVRPLARLASRAQLQRDLVVAATEAERARVAADIHDDALQELTLLVRRLDAAGDAEGADIARGVSDRLRAICGDLRLPILDDLGVGPALDWLVLRIERLAGGEVRLVRAEDVRQPPDVELAFFRIAQEALANAVKHGRTPIVVRYRATAEGASLAIDDAGVGIAFDAADKAERDGHFGLLNMAQRAEGIGAILDVRRWPKGGTHVQLEWRAK